MMRTRLAAGRSKYRAVPVVIDGIRFASKREGARYQELKLLERAGEIARLELQPRFKLTVGTHHVCTYVADFRYINGNGRAVLEDAKGVRTREYLIKRKLLKALHGIDVVEV